MLYGRNAVAQEGVVLGVILFDKNQKPLSVLVREDITRVNVAWSRDEGVLVEALLEELLELEGVPHQLERYIRENLDQASLSLVLEGAQQIEARDAKVVQATLAGRF